MASEKVLRTHVRGVRATSTWSIVTVRLGHQKELVTWVNLVGSWVWSGLGCVLSVTRSVLHTSRSSDHLLIRSVVSILTKSWKNFLVRTKSFLIPQSLCFLWINTIVLNFVEINSKLLLFMSIIKMIFIRGPVGICSSHHQLPYLIDIKPHWLSSSSNPNTRSYSLWASSMIPKHL